MSGFGLAICRGPMRPAAPLKGEAMMRTVATKRAPWRGALLLALACGLGLWLAGSAADAQSPPPGKSDAFNDGFVHGCSTGFQDAGRDGMQQAGRKDVGRYMHDADYKSGWDYGYNACFEEEKRHPKMLRDGGTRS